MNKFENCWGIYVYTGKGLAGAKPFPLYIPQYFSNLFILHLLAYEDGTDKVFRNVCI